MRENVEPAMRVILGALASRARSVGDDYLYDVFPEILARFGSGALAEALTRWCEAATQPVVLLVDEIDTLIGDTLIAVLRQLRAGYDLRPSGFRTAWCCAACATCATTVSTPAPRMPWCGAAARST